MNFIFLTWKNGENNPFEFFNKNLMHGMQEFGVNCFEIPIDDNAIKRIVELKSRVKIDAAITHQGLLSNVMLGEKPFWEMLEINLISMHGDHPCQMPPNHTADSPYIHHVYGPTSYGIYSEKFFNRKNPVKYFPFPNYFNKNKLRTNQEDKAFVFPKNLNDTSVTIENWKYNLPYFLCDFLLKSYDLIKDSYNSGERKSHHDILSEGIDQDLIEKVKNKFNIPNDFDAIHTIHREINYLYRDIASEHVLKELKDVPLKIVGRGWERQAANASKYHSFHNIGTVSESDFQFGSDYGIIDVCPSYDSLHDRTLRALASECGFITNSGLGITEFNVSAESTLFYNGKHGNLREKAELVMNDPMGHRSESIAFSASLDEKRSMRNFYQFIDGLIKKNG